MNTVAKRNQLGKQESFWTHWLTRMFMGDQQPERMTSRQRSLRCRAKSHRLLPVCLYPVGCSQTRWCDHVTRLWRSWVHPSYAVQNKALTKELCARVERSEPPALETGDRYV